MRIGTREGKLSPGVVRVVKGEIYICSDVLKNTINKSNWNSKECSRNYRKMEKRKHISRVDKQKNNLKKKGLQWLKLKRMTMGGDPRDYEKPKKKKKKTDWVGIDCAECW